jgi:cell division protein FtsL
MTTNEILLVIAIYIATIIIIVCMTIYSIKRHNKKVQDMYMEHNKKMEDMYKNHIKEIKRIYKIK